MGFGKRNLVALAAIAVILVIGMVLTVLTLFPWQVRHGTDVSEVVDLARHGQVEKILVDGNKFTVILRKGTRLEGLTASGEPLREDLRRAGVENVDALFSNP